MKKYRRKKAKSNWFVILMLFAVIVVSVGYALYTQTLEINGTVAGNADFKVYFINSWVEDSSKGTATINTEGNSDTVTYSVTLNYPGDKCVVGAQIKNESSIPVKLTGFTPTGISNDSDIKVNYEVLNTSNEVLGVNEICDYQFVVYWEEDSTAQTVDTVNFDITFNYEQNTTSPDLDKLHTHTSSPSEGGETPSAVSYTWTQTGLTVTNGEVTLDIGSSITGYSANGVDSWYVLGAEDGKLLITTNTNVGEKITLSGKDGYTNGIATLNTAAESYINGILSDGARTLNVDDLNKVTGFNPQGTNAGQVTEYGNEVTLSWDGTNKPYYSTTNGLSGNLTGMFNSGIYYPAADGFEVSTASETATAESKELITTLTSTYYFYYANSFISTDSLAYTLLFKDTGSSPGSEGTYWLGSKYISPSEFSPNYGYRAVINGGIHINGLVYGNGSESAISMGLRPVVLLKSIVHVTSDGEIVNN